ncbi:uncharacterized protein G2W53_028965 [Senna tora]|uniref:Uncharacterized protein n=1 Tax=Senna tora TaxID=362788 RepID=A0A834T6B8_9FABA|nr:uncharacterized protein G2W53_028965 [Senna tora]
MFVGYGWSTFILVVIHSHGTASLHNAACIMPYLRGMKESIDKGWDNEMVPMCRVVGVDYMLAPGDRAVRHSSAYMALLLCVLVAPSHTGADSDSDCRTRVW